MITVVVKEPGKASESRRIDDNVGSVQNLVGGYFEAHRVDLFVVFVNETAMRYMAPNIVCDCHSMVLVGTAVAMKGDNGLTDKLVPLAQHALDSRAVLGSPV